MDTIQIECALRDLPTFKGVFASDQLPTRHSVAIRWTVIVNTDIHTEPGTHWLAVYVDSRSQTGYFFDSYGLFPYISNIRDYLRYNCSVRWTHNTRQLQVLYACLFASYMDRGLSPHEFVNLFGADPDRQVELMFARQFGRIPSSGDNSRGL